MTPIYPPDIYDVEAVVAVITNRLGDLVEQHWAGTCSCGRLKQLDGPYANWCDEIYDEVYRVRDIVLTEYPLPVDPVGLVRYAACHPDVWEQHADFSGSLGDVLGTIIEADISELISDWIDGCFIAQLYANPPQSESESDDSPD
jgi:hypothetical protein